MSAVTQAAPGRYCTLHGESEVAELEYGMDFRLPRYRREVFLRFYEYHVRYRSHPGAVYYVLPYLRDRYGWDKETAYWFAYLNGCTQNPVTSWLIWSEFPSLKELDADAFARWFARDGANYPLLEFDTDRRYSKKDLVPMVADYKRNLGGATQEEFWEGKLANTADEHENFRRAWAHVMREFLLFGRLASFSYLEYMRILGTPLDCDQLFLDDLNGSKSHRNGLCKVLGRDDLDWHDSNPGFGGYSPAVLSWLRDEGELLLHEARTRMAGADYARDVGYFTLESTLCNYKSWHRPNRRYPNVYSDMFHNRIRRAEERWGDRFGVFWDARKAALPAHLRLEDTPADLGVVPAKQNHYRLTGQPIMMDREHPCFRNDYNDRVNQGEGSVLDLFK